MTSTFAPDIKTRPLELWVLSALAILLPVGFFGSAWWFYSSPEFLDFRYRMLFAEDTIWLTLLFGLQLGFQFISVLSLLRITRRDSTAIQFYRLCLGTMTIGSSGYCFLWLVYTKGYESQRLLSIVALALIVVLVMVVGFVTYLIMWSPKPHPSARLNVDDIYLKKGTLCSRLISANKSQAPTYLLDLFNVLPGDLRENLASAAETGQYDTVNVLAIVKSFNELVIDDPDFFKNHVEEIPASPSVKQVRYEIQDAHSKFTNAERRRLSKVVNRLLLEGCFEGNAISAFPGTLIPSGISVWFRRLKGGLTQAPFETLTFFFTVFLATSYLFAFSFAFDDKAHLESYGQPALFMARNRASGAVNEATQIDSKSLGGIKNDALENTPWPPYWLYVSSDGSTFVSEATSFNMENFDSLLMKRIELQERNAEITKRMQMLENQSRGSNGSKAGTDDKDRQDAYVSLKQSSESLADNKTELAKVEASLKQQLEAWKTSRNHDHIRRLVRAIEDEAAHKREIMLELVDVSNNPVNQHRERGSNRASRTAPRVNEDLVRQNIDYLLTRKLMDNSANMSNVEWFNAPSGSHSGLTEADIAATKESWEIQITKKPLAELRSSLLEKEIARIKTIKARFSATDNKIFNELFAEIAQIAQKGDLKEEQQLYEHKLNDFLTMLQEVRQVGELKGLDGWNTRIVAVSVRSVSDKHSFIPLSLMDYVYFTIYTITTTGYGDIVPTTTYAKFLCSFANILEVFFLVVFFNALLSAVKRSE